MAERTPPLLKMLDSGIPEEAVTEATRVSSYNLGLPFTKERRTIMAEINWITSFDAGLARAKAENRLALADFFNPG